MKSLLDVNKGNKLKIVKISGSYGVSRRLLSLGFHKNDLIELDSRSIMGGPLLVRNITNDTSVALGKGIANKIMVEIVDEEQ